MNYIITISIIWGRQLRLRMTRPTASVEANKSESERLLAKLLYNYLKSTDSHPFGVMET